MALSRVLIVSIAANLMNCLKKMLFQLEHISMSRTASCLPACQVGLLWVWLRQSTATGRARSLQPVIRQQEAMDAAQHTA